MTVAQLGLRCPTCGAELVEHDDEYRCDRGHVWPVLGGIPRFVERPKGGLGQIQDAFDSIANSCLAQTT